MDDNNAPRFSSEVTVDLNTFREYLYLLMDTYTRNSVIRLFVSWVALSLILGMNNGYYIKLFFVFAVILLVADWRNYRKYKDGGVEYKQLLHQHEGNIPHHILRFEDTCITSHNRRTENERSEPYVTYRKILESRNLLVLITELNFYHIVDKRTLTGGSSEELIAFLREKCPNLKKKVAKGKLGRFARRLLWVIIALGLLLALLNALHIPEKLRGQLTNDMPVREMAEELAALDIAISDRALDQILLWESDCTSLFPSYPGNSKVLDLLCWEGQGTFEKNVFYQEGSVETYDWNWTPSTSGVYWFDLEVMDCTAIYTNFLAGVDAMDENLSFSNVMEDYSRADLLTGMGIVTFSFDYLGQAYTINAQYNYDWFDTDVLRELGKILNSDSDPKNLWYIFDGQGVLLYYGTFEEVHALERKTGLYFLDPVEQHLYS